MKLVSRVLQPREQKPISLPVLPAADLLLQLPSTVDIFNI